jgi:hypothetical protein
MKPARPITHEFVDFIPTIKEEGKIYISFNYSTAVHNCFCGCGEKVVTPISPTGWTLIFDGETVSLTPSVGNWGFKCKSHYMITRGHAVWAGQMSKTEIEMGRARDFINRETYLKKESTHGAPPVGKDYVKQHKFWNWLFPIDRG